MATTEHDVALEQLYADFAANSLMPLWTVRGDLMPRAPSPSAVPQVWRWATCFPSPSERDSSCPWAGAESVVRSRTRTSGSTPEPYATPTLWAAAQYLGPREVAPAHRHSQSAFRFVLEGDGVWTVVDGDPVAMRRGDLLLTAGWRWHEHHNIADAPMVWLDGLDIPLVSGIDAGFFEFGPDELSDRSTPESSRSERLWAHPALRPVSAGSAKTSPLMAYRWKHTDAALTAQLQLESEGCDGVLAPGHAAVRFTNPTNGRDALVTMRMEMHRLASGASSPLPRRVGSSVWQVFEGNGVIELAGHEHEVSKGDVIAVPSWCPMRLSSSLGLDLFMFSDAPIYEALDLVDPK